MAPQGSEPQFHHLQKEEVAVVGEDTELRQAGDVSTVPGAWNAWKQEEGEARSVHPGAPKEPGPQQLSGPRDISAKGWAGKCQWLLTEGPADLLSAMDQYVL